MKRSAAALAVLIALTLTGCAGTTDTASDETQDVATTSTEVTETPTPTPTTEPLVAETTAPEATDAEKEAAFLVEVRERLSKIRTQIPDATDEQLLEAAHEACERIAAGTSGEDMTLIEGETRTNGYFMDTAAISTSAALTICPRS